MATAWSVVRSPLSQDKFTGNRLSGGDVHREFAGDAVRSSSEEGEPPVGMGGGTKQQWTSPSVLSDPEARRPLPADQSLDMNCSWAGMSPWQGALVC